MISTVACGGGLLTACGGGNDVTAPPPPVTPVASVTVTPATATVSIGETVQLTATTNDAAGNGLTGRTVTWASDNTTVATVSGAGLVTAVAMGSATITATSEGKSGTAAITTDVGGTLAFTSITSGGAHTCGLTAGGAAYCWGRDESGQLGAPSASSCTLDAGAFPCVPAPVAVAGGLTFTQITGGGTHTCALSGDGTAYCWGGNESGQLGDNSTTPRPAPVAVATALRFTVLDAGASHTCGLSSGGAAYCWGRNDRGQLGDGTTTSRSVPVAVSGGFTFEVVTAGGFDIGHSCGLDAGGAAYCWGDNERGQLGIGTSDVVPHPMAVSVTGGLALVSLTAGLGRHTCGLTGSGAAYCWGENTFGALGDGSTTDRLTPAAVSGGLVFAKLIAGGFIGHTCGVTDAGAAFCWGENERGQVGDGSTTDRSSPSPVRGGLSFASLDAGFRHTCALTTSNTLYCWGSGAAGQLGTNSTSQSDVPAKVVGQP